MNLTLEKFSFSILAALAFLLPLFAIPWLGLSLDIEKRLLFYLGIGAVIIIWLLGRLIDRELTLPRNWLIPAFLLIVVISLVAGLTSTDPYRSLLAFGYERDTVFALFTLFLVISTAAIFINTKERWLLIILGIVAAGGLATIFQVVQTVVTNIIGWGVFPGGAFSLIGKWNEIGFFWGLSAFLGLALLEVLPWRTPKILRYLVVACVILSILGVVMVNAWQTWLVLGLISLALLIYKVWGVQTVGKKRVPWFLLGLIVVSLVLSFLAKPNLPVNVAINSFNNRIGISTIEVNPSWSGSFLIIKDSIKDRPIFGFGPNTFAVAWNKFKPAGVNETPFWNSDFINLVGFVPTFAVTTGLIGIIAWVFFLILFLYYGFLGLVRKGNDESLQVFTMVAFMASVYLWLVLIIYSPDLVLIFLTFLLSGIFLALLTRGGVTGEFRFSWAANPRYSFAGVLVVVVLIVAILGGAYLVSERFVAGIFFSRALAVATTGDTFKATSLLASAIKISPNEVFYRVMINFKLADLEKLLAKEDITPETARAEFEVIIRDAVYSGQEAVKQSPSNYANWVSLGLVYESLVPLNIEGAYAEATKAYEKAFALNPTNPAIFVNRARLEVAAKNKTKAREYINQAINLKRNYTEAIFLLAQLDAESGNLREAIERSEESVALSPLDPVAFFQLGFLKYQAGDAKGAVTALTKAIELNPNYANARYFLGLSYDLLAEGGKALTEFQTISQSNPDNKEIAQIIENLRAGRRALENTPPPAPKDRKKLPVKDEE